MYIFYSNVFVILVIIPLITQLLKDLLFFPDHQS